MDRFTTRHCGVAVIKDKSLLKEAMEKLATYEEMEEQGLLPKSLESDHNDLISRSALINALYKEIFSAEVYNDDFDGTVIENLLCFGDVKAIADELPTVEANPATNADRIRSMTDEELADWIHNMDHHYGDDNEPMVGFCDLDTNELTEIYDSFGDLLEWLQKERSVSKGDE